ncbi:MAG: hypothetical protein BWY08_00099 [Bacteroidetes bacterium ADurb.Bin174]|jgi:hypothetical protein|nr:MAG: hypothetical protein BWY08_00099 [Bacteroidetes bacterium ADurb.Bin174]
MFNDYFNRQRFHLTTKNNKQTDEILFTNLIEYTKNNCIFAALNK